MWSGVRSRMWMALLGLAFASVAAVRCTVAQVPGQEANGDSRPDRPYDGGPLTEADFRGKPPTDGKQPGSPFQAYLFLDIKWSCQYRTAVRGRIVTAYLTQFEAIAATNPAKSWTRWGKKNPDLLDHEQGHFDITQIHALRLEIKLRKLLAAKKPLAGTGESKAAAAEALNEVLDQECKAAKAVSDQENVEYDRVTTHGTVLEKQRELRRVHQETLKQLTEELKQVKK
jgi:hypothetical protein